MFKSRLLYAVVLFLAYLLNLIFNTVETKAVLMCLVVLPVLSILICFHISRKISINLKIDKSRIEKGESTCIELSIKNPTLFLCPYLFTNLTEHSGYILENSRLICSVLPWRTQRFRTRLMGRYRGVFDIGVDSCYIEDYLRLFRFKCSIPSAYKITITPQIKPVNSKLFQYHQNDLHAPYIVGSNDNLLSFYDIVPYDQSKDVRRIHWKLTARLNDLMVRKYDKENGVAVAVLADFSQINADGIQKLAVEDKLSEAFASVAYFLMHNYNAIDFIFADDLPHVLNNCSRFDVDKIFSVCSTNPFNAMLPAVELLAHYTGLNACMNIIIITDKPQDLTQSIKNAVVRGYRFKVLHLGYADVKSNSHVEYFNFDEIFSDK